MALRYQHGRVIAPPILALYRRCHPSYLIPDQESLRTLRAVFPCFESMPPRAKMLPNRPKHCQEALSLAWGCEATHRPFTLACRLMRIFGAVIEALMLTVFDAAQALSCGGAIARQFICNKHPWDILAPFSSLRKNFVAAALFRRLWTRMSSTLPS